MAKRKYSQIVSPGTRYQLSRTAHGLIDSVEIVDSGLSPGPLETITADTDVLSMYARKVRIDRLGSALDVACTYAPVWRKRDIVSLRERSRERYDFSRFVAAHGTFEYLAFPFLLSRLTADIYEAFVAPESRLKMFWADAHKPHRSPFRIWERVADDHRTWQVAAKLHIPRQNQNDREFPEAIQDVVNNLSRTSQIPLRVTVYAPHTDRAMI